MTLLRLENIELYFDSRGVNGLRGINLSVKKGEIVALMGPSGSGKTSILQIVAKKLKPQNGHVHFIGKTALITRKSQLDHQRSVLDNLLEQNNNMDLARYWLDELSISAKIHASVDSLSGGEYQRALLAEQLMISPSLLLIDESIEQLDPLLRYELLGILKRLVKKESLSILWVTHLWAEASLFADQIAIIQFGKILQQDDPSELYFRPQSPFVAEFTGITNFQTWHRLESTKEGTSFRTPLGELTLPLQWKREDALALIRPNTLKVCPKGTIKTQIKAIDFYQNCYLYHLMIDPQHTLLLYHDAKLKIGDQMLLTIDLEGILLF